MTRRRARGLLVAVCLLVLLAAPRPAHADFIDLGGFDAGAGVFDFAGTLLQDNDIGIIRFLVADTSLFSAVTTSYASGGFDPVLSLFSLTGGGDAADLSGYSIVFDDLFGHVFNDDADPFGDATGEPVYDSALSRTLGAGWYLLAVTQSPNWPNDTLFDFSLSDEEFARFTCADETGTAGCFVDFMGQARTGNFAGTIELTSLPVSSVPEPGTLTLTLLGLAGAALHRQRGRRRAAGS